MKKQKKGCWKIMIGKREEEGTVKFSRCCDNTKRNPNADLDKNGLEYNICSNGWSIGTQKVGCDIFRIKIKKELSDFECATNALQRAVSCY
jgi:hypothetical protein